jgi:DNA-binding transcriptional MocR family regulator
LAKVPSLDAFPRSCASVGHVRYPAILGLIERAIATGQLANGASLPTQRALAQHLRVAVGTVTRAYSEAERLGLVVGEVGRGTYVSAHRKTATSGHLQGRGAVIDLTQSRPPNEPAAAPFAHALRTLSKRRDVSDLLGNEPANGWFRHRLAASKWINSRGVIATPENVVASNGVQHALAVVLAALSSANDVVATEELNYPGIALLAHLYNLNLVGLPVDEEGLRADALDSICRRQHVKFVLCSPSMHNPTTVTMSIRRREQLVQVARRRGLMILENDILGMMPTQTLPTVKSLAPEYCCYMTGLTKVVATGLRLGFVVAPSAVSGRVTSALHSTTWMPPPLMSELFMLLLEDGSLKHIIDWHRMETSARASLARQLLAPTRALIADAHYHLWVQLPPHWPEDPFIEAARSRGVLVMPGRAFSVPADGRSPHAVRIGLGSMNSRDRLETALRTLASILKTPAERSNSTTS